jgi:hypothetical protein
MSSSFEEARWSYSPAHYQLAVERRQSARRSGLQGREDVLSVKKNMLLFVVGDQDIKRLAGTREPDSKFGFSARAIFKGYRSSPNRLRVVRHQNFRFAIMIIMGIGL